MEETLILNLPITTIDLADLERLIEAESIFVSGNFKMPRLVAAEGYLSGRYLNGESYRVLFDRNILSRLINLAKGHSVEGADENAKLTRYAAACLAFCIISEIDVEHGMALYEGAFTSGHDVAEREHKLFLTINNTNPIYCTDIALGRANEIPKEHLQEIAEDPEFIAQVCRESNLAKELNLWRINYLHLLKMADLRRKVPKGMAPAELYLKWLAEDSFYNAPAAIFGLAAISPSPPKGGMLKKVMTADTNELSKSIRNATWDVCYITQWGRWLRETHAENWLFASHDVALRKILSVAFCDESDSEEELLQSFFVACWGKRDGTALAKIYGETKALAQLGTKSRVVRVKKYIDNIGTHIAAIEKSLGIDNLAI